MNKTFIIENTATRYLGKATNLRVPEGINVVNSGAFFDEKNYNKNETVKRVLLPHSFSNIERNPFSRCLNLEEWFIPASVTNIKKSKFDWENFWEEKSFKKMYVEKGSYAEKFAINENIEYGYFGDIEIEWDDESKDVWEINTILKKYNGTDDTVIIPEYVTVISDYAFEKNEFIKTVVLPEKLVLLNPYAFSNCAELESVVGLENTRISNIAIATFYLCKKLKSIKFPVLLKRIEASAFCGCSCLEEIIIPDGCEEIENYAFNCCKPHKLVIPKSVTKFGIDALPSADKSIWIWGEADSKIATKIRNSKYNFQLMDENGNPIEDLNSQQINKVENQVMNEKIANACRIFEASLTAIKEIFDKTRKYGTPTVRDFTFRADNIEDIKKCANEIESAFDIMYDCIAVLGFYSLCKDDKDKFVKFCKSSLDNMLNKKSYELSGLIVYETAIAAAIACYCIAESAITAECDIVKDKYQYRGDYDDGNITWSLSSDTKKASVKSTDSEIQQDYSVSLQYDDAIIKKWAEEHNKPVSKMDIKNDWKLEERSDGAICLKKYKGNDKIVNIPDNVTIIADRAFLDCNDITNVTIPDSIKSIESYAFSGCTSLTNITIPDSVISIGDAAFCGCTGLTNITLNNGINSIGKYTFSGCTGLTKIDIPASVTTIGYSAFDKCTGLKNIAIPDSVTSIGECAFYGCRSLTNITIPDGVISIKKSMFYNCTGLTSITIPNSVSLIEECAFYGCQGLTNIILPQNITSIRNSMFECCTSFAEIILPDSVTSIGEFAFCGCSGMTSITIPTSVNKIENFAFCGCSKLTIHAPAGSYAEEYAKSNNIPFEAI